MLLPLFHKLKIVPLLANMSAESPFPALWTAPLSTSGIKQARTNLPCLQISIRSPSTSVQVRINPYSTTAIETLRSPHQIDTSVISTLADTVAAGNNNRRKAIAESSGFFFPFPCDSLDTVAPYFDTLGRALSSFEIVPVCAHI